MADPILPPSMGTPAPTDSAEGASVSFAAELRRIHERLAAIERVEERRAGVARTLTVMWGVFGSAITAGALALAAWVWSVQGDVNDLTHATQRNAERLAEHASRGGPQGHPDSVIERTALNEGRVRANSDAVARIEARLQGVELRLDEVLDRLPSRRGER